MADTSALTALALNALFGMCVPGVSQGKLEQTFQAELVLPLTDQEKMEFGDAIKGDDRSYRIQSADGLILMSVKGGFCRIITAEGDTEKAAQEFRTKLKAAGGYEDELKPVQNDFMTIDGMIPLGGGDIVALVFSAQQKSNAGFFASAFGAHKD